jgi:hypothetical protein
MGPSMYGADGDAASSSRRWRRVDALAFGKDTTDGRRRAAGAGGDRMTGGAMDAGESGTERDEEEAFECADGRARESFFWFRKDFGLGGRIESASD